MNEWNEPSGRDGSRPYAGLRPTQEYHDRDTTGETECVRPRSPSPPTCLCSNSVDIHEMWCDQDWQTSGRNRCVG